MKKLMFAFVLAIPAVCSVPWPAITHAADPAYTGIYENHQYGYSVALPPGTVAEPYPDAVSNQGFVIGLADAASSANVASRNPLDLSRSVVVQAIYDLNELGSLERVVSDQLERVQAAAFEEARKGTQVRVAQTLPARLDTLPARRAILDFVNARKVPCVKQVVVAYRPQKDATGIIYVLQLNTTRERFESDVEGFGKVLAAFKIAGVK